MIQASQRYKSPRLQVVYSRCDAYSFANAQFRLHQVQQTSRRTFARENFRFDSEESQAPLGGEPVQLDGRRAGSLQSHFVQRQLAEAARRSEAMRRHVQRTCRGMCVILVKTIFHQY